MKYLLSKLAIFFCCSVLFFSFNALAATPQVSGGLTHSIALHENGNVWTWGDNKYGQLGNGANNDSVVPVPVENISRIISVSGGSYHNLALQWDGIVWAWGDNGYGQVSQSCSTISANTPHIVTGLLDVTSVSGGGFFSLAVKKNGTVWGWGRNENGELGTGTSGGGNNSISPVQTLSLSNVVAVSAGNLHSLALKDDGTVWAWGSNLSGQLGNGSSGGLSSTPIHVSTLSNVVAVSAGGSYSLALKSDNTVWAWGKNSIGQLGQGAGADEVIPLPVQVGSLSDVIALSAGGAHSLALKRNGTVVGWGSNLAYNFGDSDHWVYFEPVPVKNLSHVVSVSTGNAHSLFIKDDGRIETAGGNSHGQFG